MSRFSIIDSTATSFWCPACFSALQTLYPEENVSHGSLATDVTEDLSRPREGFLLDTDHRCVFWPPRRNASRRSTARPLSSPPA